MNEILSGFIRILVVCIFKRRGSQTIIRTTRNGMWEYNKQPWEYHNHIMDFFTKKDDKGCILMVS